MVRGIEPELFSCHQQWHQPHEQQQKHDVLFLNFLLCESENEGPEEQIELFLISYLSYILFRGTCFKSMLGQSLFHGAYNLVVDRD